MFPVRPRLLVCKWCICSCAISTLSVINLPRTKAHCDGEIKSGSHFFKRLAITLDITLYITFHKLMGQKFLITSICFVLGINTTCIWLRDGEISPEFRECKATLVIDGPTIYQYLWKKISNIPSGPGALRGCICISASLTSNSSYTLVRSDLISSEMHPCKVSSALRGMVAVCSINKLLKYSTTTLSLSLCSCQFPSASFILEIVFYYLLCDALE